MRIYTQNLTDDKFPTWLNGRAWVYILKNCREAFHFEWSFFNKARSCAVTMNFGSGDNDDSVSFHVALPFLFSIYFIICGVMRLKKEVHTGIAIHNGAIWFYILPYAMESNSSDPWWRKTHCWQFPWQLDWLSTEILSHKAFLPYLQETVWIDRKGNKLGDKVNWSVQDAAASSVTEEYDYTYRLKNGKIQNRRAKVHVKRMTWRARWWPIIPRIKVSTSIDVRFNDEVGEKTGSWKGGCIGCSYEMKIGETPLETLRRMEKERTF